MAFDTIPAQKEAEAIICLLREFPDAKAWISFSCKDDKHVCHGEPLSAAAALTLACPQVVAVGVNCVPPQTVAGLLDSLPAEVKKAKAIVVYPNSGESWTKEHKWEGGADVVPLSAYVPDWVERGARWIGGCCRTTPRDLTAIRDALLSATS